MLLRVAMITRSTLHAIPGGDTVQVMQTANQLNQPGVHVDVKLTDETIAYEQYDLLHFFNIIRPADILYHVKRSGKPYVISTILIDYSGYDKWERSGVAGLLFRYLSANSTEYLKTTARWLLGRDRVMSKAYLWRGQRRSMLEVLNKAMVLLPNSQHEYERLVNKYPNNTEHIVVPNGIDDTLFLFDPTIEKDPLMVICCARIEGIKNQLNLIKALNGTKFQLYIIGAPAPNQLVYYQTCKKMAAANIHFIEQMPQAELINYYKKAKVHVLPSWFETTGLSSLEAAAMGCSVVITDKGDAKEYFDEHAFYCDPSSSTSIYAAIDKAANASDNEILRQKVLTSYTWQKAAEQTLLAYQKTMDKA